MRKTLVITFLFFNAVAAYSQTGELKGTVTDKASGVTLDDASVKVYYGDSLYATVVPDFAGNYSLMNLPVGKITIVCSKERYATLIEKNIPIDNGRISFVDLKLRKSSKNNDIDLIEFKDEQRPKEEVVKEVQPTPPPAQVTPATKTQPETITLLTDSQVTKNSVKQGYYFKVGNGEPQRIKYFANNLSPYVFQNADAYAELNKYKSIKAAKLGLQIGFVGLVGIYAGSFFFDKKNQDFFGGYRIFLLSGAVACIGVSAFLDEVKDKHLKRSIDIYNKSIRTIP